MTVEPFRIEVSNSVLEDLRERLARTRFAAGWPKADWNGGTDPSYLATLCAYWRRDFDWRRQEQYLNGFPHFRADVDGVGLHFIHQRGKGRNPIPLLLIHGWPDSFARFLKIIPMLTDPETHRGAADGDATSFDVIVPSLPGFGFSDRPQTPGMTFVFHDLLHKLMVDKLGYRRFAVHGGDWGGMVAEHMGRSHAASLIGLHLTDVPFFHMFREPSDPSRFSRDEILTHIMIYWATQTIDSSFFPYYDMANAGAVRWISEMVKGWLGSADVPAGFALFPKDLVTPPREWAERFFNVRRWTEMPRGGHFAAMEEPALLAQDLRATFAPLWEAEHPRGAHTAPAAMSAVP